MNTPDPGHHAHVTIRDLTANHPLGTLAMVLSGIDPSAAPGDLRTVNTRVPRRPHVETGLLAQFVAEALRKWSQMRRRAITYRELSRLDDNLLRDIGFERETLRKSVDGLRTQGAKNARQVPAAATLTPCPAISTLHPRTGVRLPRAA